MGSHSYYTHKTWAEAVMDELDDSRHEVVKRSGHYFAVRIKEGCGEGDVFGLVVLGSKSKSGEVWIKYVDETMGPAESRCPKSILDLLSPTENQYALDWRERCRKYHELKASQPKLKGGETIKLSRKVRFNDGVEEDTFRFQKGSRSFRQSDGRLVHLGRSWKTTYGWEVAA